MKNIKYFIPPALLVIVAAVLFYNILYITAPVPTGTWKAVDEDYYVVFKNDGTYVESHYNIPREFKYTANSMSYYDIAGEAHTTSLRENYKGRMAMTLCGRTYVLEKTEQTPKLSTWSEGMTGNPLSAYKLVNDFSDFFYIRLFDDDVYRSVCGEDEVIGRYVITSDKVLYLLSKDGGIIAQWTPWSQGYATFEMDTDVVVVEGSEDLEDKILLKGKAVTKDAGVKYNFHDDGSVSVDMGNDEVYKYTYTVDESGLIVMKDIEGAATMDALYRNPADGRMYRYVIATDGWFEFLSQ